MGNQQERLDIDMAWLAGFWEGEGYISLTKCSHTSKRQLGRPRYVPAIGCCNTDYVFLDEIKRILGVIDISFCIQQARITGIGKKPKWEIRIKGMEKIHKFCDQIFPFLRGEKRNRAKKLMDYCVMRKAKLIKNHQAPYGDEEENCYQEMYSFKGRVETKILNDYTSRAVQLNGKDRV